ncbi:MAG: prepilin-type N-terminal cleavage/methylation domain-containing protein [Sedimentisphaerales bacterium]|jgi:prepilin-type N-terminal cleavage/methylation domain-containing protein
MLYCAALSGQIVTDMESINNKTRSYKRAFTLVEVLAALTIGTMVLLAVLALYNRGQSGSAAIMNKLESSRLPREVFQRIAEDLDRVAGGGQGVQIDILNKLQDGLSAAKLEIFRPINDAKDQQQTLEKIVWQSSTDPESGLLTLYRSHSGIAMEDALLDNQKEPSQRELFVPICSGITFFKIEVPKDDNATSLDRWTEGIPPAIRITMSFAQPYKTVIGTFDVPEEEKIVRTIAVDRTRRPTFTIPSTDANQADVNGSGDANNPADNNQPTDDASKPTGSVTKQQSGEGQA